MLIKVRIRIFWLICCLCSTSISAAPPQIAIIIDDLGTNWTQAKKVLELPTEVTASILPFTPHAKTIAKRASSQGRAVMLHVPMEADEKNELLGPGALRASMTGWQLVTQLRKDIVSMPTIVGINNHMGSHLTRKEDTMKWVMGLLKWQGLYFIDSRTTSESVALSVASSMGVLSSSRDVFLDHIISTAEIDKEFLRAVAIAEKTGFAIIIGHPHDETIEILNKRIPLLKAAGIKLVSPAEIIQGRKQKSKSSGASAVSIFSLFDE